MVAKLVGCEHRAAWAVFFFFFFEKDAADLEEIRARQRREAAESEASAPLNLWVS